VVCFGVFAKCPQSNDLNSYVSSENPFCRHQWKLVRFYSYVSSRYQRLMAGEEWGARDEDQRSIEDLSIWSRLGRRGIE
jgi:hypothetical protein